MITTPILLVLVILAVATLLFLFEVFTVDKISFFILISIMLLGLASPEESVSGFSNPAVITIMALMILATALEKNGVILLLADKLKGIANWPLWLGMSVLMVIVAGISSVVSTTAVVIVFVKLINDLAESHGLERSKLLLPISFAGILGGSCTLMGTSTNLLVNNIFKQQGGSGFTFFEFSHLGVTFFVVAAPIIVLLASYVLPRTQFKSLSEIYDLKKYLTVISIQEGDPMADQLIRDTILFANEKIRILSLQREGDIIDTPGKYIRLRHGDRLLLQAPTDELQDIYKQADLPIPENAMNEEEDELTKNEIYELVMLPNSPLINLSLQDIPDQLPGGIVFLAMHKSEDPLKKTVIKLLTTSVLRLEAGDRILVSGTNRRVQWFAHQNDAIVLRSIIGNSEAGRFGQIVSVGALITVVVAATTGVFTLMQSALFGVAICLFTGILDFRDAYRGINWQVIFLLAGMIPLGIAMQNTGTDAFIAQKLNDWLSGFSPAVIISLIFLFTMIMSGFVSNNATAIIIAPVALAIAGSLGAAERPFIYAVMFAANFSFFTPIGYQTNAIIYGLGIYSFRHFLFIGGIISIVIWLVASFLLAGYL